MCHQEPCHVKVILGPSQEFALTGTVGVFSVLAGKPLNEEVVGESEVVGVGGAERDILSWGYFSVWPEKSPQSALPHTLRLEDCSRLFHSDSTLTNRQIHVNCLSHHDQIPVHLFRLFDLSQAISC